MQELIQQIVDNPGASLAIIGNLIIIESLLSVDNAAVLATMVMDLPDKQRDKALKYGIIGAYVFRGLAMIFAAFLIKIWWLTYRRAKIQLCNFLSYRLLSIRTAFVI